jgi:hypothetical protein
MPKFLLKLKMLFKKSNIFLFQPMLGLIRTAPIEHLWFVLKKRLRERHFRNTDELFQAIQEECSRIPRDTILGLGESMPRRYKSVIKAMPLSPLGFSKQRIDCAHFRTMKCLSDSDSGKGPVY